MHLARAILIPTVVAAAVFALALVLAGGEETETDGPGARPPAGSLAAAQDGPDAPRLTQLGGAPGVPAMKPEADADADTDTDTDTDNRRWRF